MNERTGFPTAADLPSEIRDHLRDLLVTLADNKRVLGIRYSDWILGAPSVEAGIACSAMAQDEWGHGRIVYAMLKDFGLDPNELEHERESDGYHSSELLDAPVETWPELLALNLLLDTALSVQFEAMESSLFEPIHYKARKLLDEERFHFEHARGWVARLALTDAGRGALRDAFESAWQPCMRSFGPADDALGNALAEAGVAASRPDELRTRWLDRVGPVVDAAGLALAEPASGGWTSPIDIDWTDWSAKRRRRSTGGPDPDTLARVRGDRNRALLMD